MRVLIPRLTADQAAERLAELERLLLGGRSASQLVQTDWEEAVPNATGGRAPTGHDVKRWRDEIAERMHGLPVGGQPEQAIFARELGRAIAEIIDPSRSDAAHDGTWAFLSLMVFPDLVAQRWPLGGDGHLSPSRWVGAQLGRDRNYLKLSWRNWSVLGPVMEEADPPLGEDEFLSLLERTSLARSPRVVQLAARQVIGLDPRSEIARSHFARELLKRITFETGPLVLDLLDNAELETLIRELADSVVSSAARPRRAATP